LSESTGALRLAHGVLAPHVPPSSVRRTHRRTVEGGDEQVTVDYANDLDTGMCVSYSFTRPRIPALTRAHLHSYGSGFAQSPDAASDCGWDLNRLNENPENVLRAVGSCLPGVTRCARCLESTWHPLALTLARISGRGCTWECSLPPFAGTRRTTTCTASTSCTTGPPRAGMAFRALLQAGLSARCGTACHACLTRCVRPISVGSTRSRCLTVSLLDRRPTCCTG